MTGDISGGSQVEFTGFPAGQKAFGGGTLADFILWEYEQIVAKFKASLAGDVVDLRKLRKLADAILTLSRMLNNLTNKGLSPEQAAKELQGAIGAVKADIKALFPGKKADSPYYKQLMGSVADIEKMLKGGVVQLLEKVAKDIQAVINWFNKEFHDHKPGHHYMSHHHHREELAKQLMKLMEAVQGDITLLKNMEDAWKKGSLGPVPPALHKSYEDAKNFWNALMHLDLESSIVWKGGPLSKFWTNKGKLGWWLAGALFAGKDEHSHWHKLVDYTLVGWKEWVYPAGTSAIKYIEQHKKLAISSATIIKAIREMATDTGEGFKLRQNLPGIWNAYEEAMRQCDQMKATTTSMGNGMVSNISSKTMALKQITATISKDLMVPIQAVNMSISRILS